jgi:hypothetical protein
MCYMQRQQSHQPRVSIIGDNPTILCVNLLSSPLHLHIIGTSLSLEKPDISRCAQSVLLQIMFHLLFHLLLLNVGFQLRAVVVLCI